MKFTLLGEQTTCYIPRDRKEIFKSENGLKYVLAETGDTYDIIAKTSYEEK